MAYRSPGDGTIGAVESLTFENCFLYQIGSTWKYGIIGFLMVRVWFIFEIALFLPLLVSAQPPIFSSGINVVQVGVTVVDREGRLVTDLEVDDFSIFEEGKPEGISYFARSLSGDSETAPLHLGVLFDSSGSMEQDGRFVKTAIIKFLNTVTYAEDITLVDFDSEVRVSRFYQDDFPRLVERVRNRQSGGMTALYDALGVYLDGAFSQDGRKVLLIYTDGEDTRSLMKFGEMTNLVRASDVTIYAIGFQKNLRPSVRNRQRMRLQQLTDVTGGRSFFPDSIDKLDSIYVDILDEFLARYVLGFVPSNERLDGTWRNLEVKLSNGRPDLKGATIRAREGYYALFSEDDSSGR